MENATTNAQTHHGSGGEGGLVKNFQRDKWFYFSKTLKTPKTVQMVYKMLDEDYFMIFH